MKTLTKLTTLAAVLLLAAAVAAAATEPLAYGSNTIYAGAGKHPKSAVSGLILDAAPRGTALVCYDYILITSDKVKGQISGIAERIRGNQIQRIATFGSTKVVPFDFSQIPPSEDRCTDAPTEQPGFNFGIAQDCVPANAGLDADDIVRWTFKFKKSSKLKGQDAFIQISGSVLPLGGLTTDAARTEQLLRWVDGSRRDLLPRRGR